MARLLNVDRDALLRAVSARGEQLLGTWLDLVDGSLHELVEGQGDGRQAAIEARIEANPERLAKVPVYPREYRLMTEFVDEVDDDALAVRLDAALAGGEAFRRFDALLQGAERARWTAFRAEAHARWATAWLHGLDLTVPWAVGAAPPTPLPLLLALVGSRTIACASESEARETFVRLVREVCELLREPFQAGRIRGRTRFVRGDLAIVRSGAQVAVTVG
jgi:hypothetical protein